MNQTHMSDDVNTIEDDCHEFCDSAQPHVTAVQLTPDIHTLMTSVIALRKIVDDFEHRVGVHLDALDKKWKTSIEPARIEPIPVPLPTTTRKRGRDPATDMKNPAFTFSHVVVVEDSWSVCLHSIIMSKAGRQDMFMDAPTAKGMFPKLAYMRGCVIYVPQGSEEAGILGVQRFSGKTGKARADIAFPIVLVDGEPKLIMFRDHLPRSFQVYWESQGGPTVEMPLADGLLEYNPMDVAKFNTRMKIWGRTQVMMIDKFDLEKGEE